MNVLRMKILFFLILAFTLHVTEAARILCIFPFNGKSHFKMFGALCKGLAKRGHRIDVVSHFPTKTPLANYTDIVDLSTNIKGLGNTFTVEYARKLSDGLTYYISKEYGGALCHLMGAENMQNFIKNPPNDPPYELVITQHFGSPCYLGFGELLNVPVIVASSFLSFPLVNDMLGNPQNYAFHPGFYTQNAVVSTFFDRLWNFVSNHKEMIAFQYYTSDQTEMMRKYLGSSKLPDVRELEKKVSLALVNSHHSYYGIRPVVPAIVEVGGLHVQDDGLKLSPEIQKWIDSADRGLVYFSMGTLLSIETLSRDVMLSLYAAFSKISPVKILMKCNNSTKLPPGLPDNVITTPWTSQVSVLKHKNTRVFVTHGGLMGTQEAVYYGVPMIGIPVFVDQMKNVNILVHKNIAIHIDLDSITEHSLDAALNAVLYDPKYREAAQKTSKLFRDRPMSALDTAVYWVEYIIRNGPDSLTSPSRDLPWWKLHLVDVFAFLIVSSLSVLCAFISLLRFTLKSLRKYYEIQTKVKLN